MSSPFPGMDPYLEDPQTWRGLHNRLLTFTAEALNRLLPPGYLADIDERCYLVFPPRDIYPDVQIQQRLEPLSTAPPRAGRGSAALADPPFAVTVAPEALEERREGFIEIRATQEDNRLVTIIEMLSPSNKTPRSAGRESYLRKQQEVLHSAAHLLEIDLLRSGEPTVAVPRDVLPTDQRWNYIVCLHRADAPYTYHFWLNQMQERLPRVAVPLTAPDADLTLDLQAVFQRAYASGPYRQRIDYAAEPTVPFTREERVWADALLRKKRLRKASKETP